MKIKGEIRMRKYLVACYEGGIVTPAVLLWETKVNMKEDFYKDKEWWYDIKEAIVLAAGKKLRIKKAIIQEIYDKSNEDIDYVIHVDEIINGKLHKARLVMKDQRKKQ